VFESSRHQCTSEVFVGIRAALLRELNQDLEVRDDFELTDAGPGEVRVRMVASGVCHSDVSFQNGTTPVPLPSIIGHEGAGEILQVGEGVEHLAVGDPVIISWVPPCGRCFFCVQGEPHLCANAMAAAGATPHFRLGDELIHQGIGTATFAEETVIRAEAAVKVSRDTPLDIASLVGCGVMTGVGAAMNTARVRPGSSCLVIGCGGIGISTIMGARASGAEIIVGVDTVARKLDWARKFGATHAAKPEDLKALKVELTENRGFDYAFEAVGTARTFESALRNTRRGGVTVMIGMAAASETIELSVQDIFVRERKILGSFYGSANVNTDFHRMLELWKNGQLDLEGMITRRIDLGEINEAFAAMLGGEVIRSVIEYN
jgi:S-(hydroxymethyl)glutathione dehydrogenase/alcohol dehydrogenase